MITHVIGIATPETVDGAHILAIITLVLTKGLLLAAFIKNKMLKKKLEKHEKPLAVTKDVFEKLPEYVQEVI